MSKRRVVVTGLGIVSPVGIGIAAAWENLLKGVSGVAPGFIETDMTRALAPDQVKKLVENVPLGRLGRVEDIAQAVLFLCSPAAGYITGATLHVNGGMHMD